MYIDHVGINTNDMEATLQFYCGTLGMRLVRTTRTPDGRRHYNVEIGSGNAFAAHCQLKQRWYPPAVGGAAPRCREVLGAPTGLPPIKRKGPRRSTRPS